MDLAYIAGRTVPLADATVPVTDRGFLLGDAIYETIRTEGGRPLLPLDHIDRLRTAGQITGIGVDGTDAEWVGRFASLCPGGERVLRVTVTRGDSGIGLRAGPPGPSRLVITSRLWPRPARRILRVQRDPSGASRVWNLSLAMKASGRLTEVVLLERAREAGFDDVLLRGRDGTWTESTTANLFIVDASGALITPADEAGLLPGVTRSLVRAVARRAGIRIEEGRIDDRALQRAREVLLCSTLLDVASVGGVDAGPVGDGGEGPVARTLIEEFAGWMGSLVGANRLRDVGAESH